MLLQAVKGLSGLMLSLSLLTVGGPLVGEWIATRAPYFPARALLDARGLGLPMEEVSFRAQDGSLLRGWFFPAGDPQAPAILYAPATGRDQRSGLPLVGALHEAGYHVLLFSYRGHGASQGRRWGFTYGARESRDVDAAVAFLREEKGIRRIGAIGHSAGAVSVLLSAARNPRLGAVVAAAPFPSVEAVWETNRPRFFPRALLEMALSFSEVTRGYTRRQVRPLDVVAGIAPQPLLLMHGLRDKRISEEQARAIYAAAQAPKELWLVEGADHRAMGAPILTSLMEGIIAFFDAALRADEESGLGTLKQSWGVWPANPGSAWRGS